MNKVGDERTGGGDKQTKLVSRCPGVMVSKYLSVLVSHCSGVLVGRWPITNLRPRVDHCFYPHAETGKIPHEE